MSPHDKNISATFHVYFKEEEVSNSPMHVPLTPTIEAVAGCTRSDVYMAVPTAASTMSTMCRSRLHVMLTTTIRRRQKGWGTLNNVYLDLNHIIIFPPPGGGGDFKIFTTNLSKWDINPEEGGGEEGSTEEEREGGEGQFRTLSFGVHM
jgi:hypothetical protein